MTEIMQANLGDVDELSYLFDSYRVFYENETNRQGALTFLSQRIDQNESIIFIARVNGKLVGFTQMYPLFSSTNMRRLWLLNDLYIKPEFRGMKISKLLISRAKQLAIETNAVGISLETAKTNDVGNNLYPATEFKLDEDHNYYFWPT